MHICGLRSLSPFLAVGAQCERAALLPPHLPHSRARQYAARARRRKCLASSWPAEPASDFQPPQVVKWLWDIVRELHADDQRRFLKFFTGSDRAPIGGLSNLRCIIQRDGPDSNKLPTSHTCFNTLLLPSYVSRLKMEERLRLAIDWSAQGFGLE